MDAFKQFKREGHAEKLKTSITSDLLPSDNQDLLVFMCNLSQISSISGMSFTLLLNHMILEFAIGY